LIHFYFASLPKGSIDALFLMPAFTTARRRRKRRSGTIRQVAIDFGVHERTLRRWITTRPELRPTLRAYRRGKQWRLDVPEPYSEFELYKEAVFRAVEPFRRKRRKRISPLTKKIARSLGYHGEHQILQELGLSILRLAIHLKLWEAKPTRAFKKRSEIRRAATDCRGLVRIIAAQHGLYGNDIFKAREYLDRTDSNQRELLKLWPTRAHWKKASEERRHLWRKLTLSKAAYELARDKKITGKNLSELLFLTEGRELMWKQHEKLKQVPNAYLPPKIYSYGRRGISLRLFRQRYQRDQIVEARNIAEGLLRSESETNRDEDGKDKSGYGSQIRVQSNDSQDTQRDKDVLPLEDREEVKIINDPSVQKAIRACEKAIREAQTDANREVFQKYLRTLKADENFWGRLR
jgi:hypothetical protein